MKLSSGQDQIDDSAAQMSYAREFGVAYPSIFASARPTRKKSDILGVYMWVGFG